LFDDLVTEGRAFLARLIDHDGKRRLQRMGKVADLRARTLGGVLIGLYQRVQLRAQRLDLGRQVTLQAPRAPGTNIGEALLDGAQRLEAVAHLNDSCANEAETGEGERDHERETEIVEPSLDEVLVAGDDIGVVSWLLVIAEVED